MLFSKNCHRCKLRYGRASNGVWLLILILLVLAGELAATQDYAVGPDDVLMVSVMRHPEMSGDNVVVSTDGKIHLPVVGALQVSGLTIQQITAAITERLRERLVSPEVTVALKQPRVQSVFVLGAARNPGVYQLKPGWRVTEALASAGGLTIRPELVDAILFHPDQRVVPLDLPTILREGNDPANLVLEPGAVLNFSERTIPITVMGSVLRPGTYDMRVGGGILEAVALGGGVLPRADLSRLVVKKVDGSQQQFDIVPAMLHGEAVQEVALEAGDVVLVPESTARVAVVGAAHEPGYFDLQPGVTMRVADLVARAGGLTARPELVQGSIFRLSGEALALDLPALFVEGKSEANLALQPGDVLSLAERTITVNVAGQVQRPGSYDLPVGSGVVEAVAAAGGVSDGALLTGVILQRKDGATCRVNLFQVMVKGDLGANVPLQHGDLIVVPESKAKVAVLGAVHKPGYYDIDEDSAPTVAQMVAEAGGSLKRARIGETAVVRVEEGQAKRIMVDLTRVLHAGRTEEDLVVQGNDVIYVPGERTDWDLLLRVLSTVGIWSRWLIE